MSILPWLQFGADLIGGIFSSKSASDDAQKNREFQRQERLETQEWQEGMMQKQNALSRSNQQWAYDKFDSPAAQRAALENAGINPFLQGSAVQTGVSSAQSAPSPPSGNPSSGSMPSGAKYQAQMMAAGSVGHALQLDADLKLKDAQARNIDADTRSKNNANNAFDVEVERSIRRAIRDQAAADATMAKIKAAFTEMREIDDMRQREAIYRETLQKIDNLVEQGKLTKEQAALAKEQIKTETARQGLLDEQTTDIKKTRPSRIAKTQSEADVNEANKKRIETLTQAELGEIYSRIDESYQRRKSMNRQDAFNALKLILADTEFSDDLVSLEPQIKTQHATINFGNIDVLGIVRRIEKTFDEDRAKKVRELMNIAFDIDKIY